MLISSCLSGHTCVLACREEFILESRVKSIMIRILKQTSGTGRLLVLVELKKKSGIGIRLVVKKCGLCVPTRNQHTNRQYKLTPRWTHCGYIFGFGSCCGAATPSASAESESDSGSQVSPRSTCSRVVCHLIPCSWIRPATSCPQAHWSSCI